METPATSLPTAVGPYLASRGRANLQVVTATATYVAKRVTVLLGVDEHGRGLAATTRIAIMSGIADSTRDRCLTERCLARDRPHEALDSLSGRCIGVQSAGNASD